MSKKIYNLTVEPITAVHIGTGEELTPLDYKIIQTKSGKILYTKFSSDSILKRFVENGDMKKLSEFERANNEGNMRALQKFFQENCTADDIDYPCDTTKEFRQLYNRNVEKDPYENAAKVFQMYRPEGLQSPVMPGSSLKGAVRTAVLNKIMYDLPDDDYKNQTDRFDKLSNDKAKERFDSDLQKALLGNYKDAKQDPFRAVEISDCKFSTRDSQIVGVLKNISFEKNTQSITALDKLQIQAEVIKGMFMDTHQLGTAQIRINTDLQSVKNGVMKRISLQDIVKSCNSFYITQFRNEYDKFYEDTVDDTCETIVKLKKYLEDIVSANENEFIIRVGRWSQVEFVTFGKDFRTPKTREIHGKKLPYGTTRTVFNYDGKYLPMGWCKCTVTDI